MVKLESEIVNEDDPLYTDSEYLKRRRYLESLNSHYEMGTPIAQLDYLPQELETWQYIWDRLMPGIAAHGCQTFIENMDAFREAGIFKREEIPQLQVMNAYLNKRTNWRIKPVSGIISQRQYLNCLAFRTFCSTQYIRHHATPEYTPEPDICHEFFGHMAMFADPAICELSHKIGLLSLGASDYQISILGAIYWYTIEFGITMEKGKRKFYGAGVASSFKEQENMLACEDIRMLDLVNSMVRPEEIVIQDVQPHYYYVRSFQNVVAQLDHLGRTMGKPFHCHYDFVDNKIIPDRALEFVNPI